MHPDYLTHHEELYRERRVLSRYVGWETEYGNAKAALRRVLRIGYAPTSGRLLELGCGAGNITVWFAKQGYDTYGIDISPTAIEWAIENAEREGAKCSFAVGSVLEATNYRDMPFDFILDGNLVHCIVGTDRRQLFKNVRGALKPNGYFLVRHVLSPVDGHLTDRYRFDPDSHLLFHGDMPYRYLPTFDMLDAELREAGFRVLNSELTYDLSAERGFQLAMFELST